MGLQSISKLRKDFTNWWKAYLFSRGLWGKRTQLKTADGFLVSTDAEDLPIWEEYLNPKNCQEKVREGLFEIYSLSGQFLYRVKPGNYKVAHEPGRYFSEVLNQKLFRELDESEKKVFSQQGEDGVLEKIFAKLG